jgi:hypothetical protein
VRMRKQLKPRLRRPKVADDAFAIVEPGLSFQKISVRLPDFNGLQKVLLARILNKTRATGRRHSISARICLDAA